MKIKISIAATAVGFNKGQFVAVKVGPNEWYCGAVTKVKRDGSISVEFNDLYDAEIGVEDLKDVHLVAKKGLKRAYTTETIKTLFKPTLPKTRIKQNSDNIELLKLPNVKSKNLKITQVDFDALRDALEPIVQATPNLYEQYKEKGYSDMRYNWDVLRASKFNTSRLYDYLNDAHINSALAFLLGNSGKSNPK